MTAAQARDQVDTGSVVGGRWVEWMRSGRVRKFAVIAERVG